MQNRSGQKTRKGSRRVTHRYSPSLNFVAALVAIAGMYTPISLMGPETFVQETRSMAAGSGAAITASVPENPYSMLAEQLRAKEEALVEREAALSGPDERRTYSLGEIFGFLGFALSLVLSVFIGINFYMDVRRGRKPGLFENKYAVDLR